MIDTRIQDNINKAFKNFFILNEDRLFFDEFFSYEKAYRLAKLLPEIYSNYGIWDRSDYDYKSIGEHEDPIYLLMSEINSVLFRTGYESSNIEEHLSFGKKMGQIMSLNILYTSRRSIEESIRLAHLAERILEVRGVGALLEKCDTRTVHLISSRIGKKQDYLSYVDTVALIRKKYLLSLMPTTRETELILEDLSYELSNFCFDTYFSHEDVSSLKFMIGKLKVDLQRELSACDNDILKLKKDFDVSEVLDNIQSFIRDVEPANV